MGEVTVEGKTQFYIGVNTTADEVSEWSPQKITDFFQGIAQVVIAAKDNVVIQVNIKPGPTTGDTER